MNKKELAEKVERNPFNAAFPIQRTDIGSSCGARLFKLDSHLSASKSGANSQMVNKSKTYKSSFTSTFNSII